MPVFNIKVKWGKEQYKLDVNTDEDVMLFKVKHFFVHCLFCLDFLHFFLFHLTFLGSIIRSDWRPTGPTKDCL